MSAAATRASERLRPRWHFSPEQNWINDPNGLVYADGEYHLFFQYNPFGDTWGHMSWGHAVSADLLHWRELPLAIPEDERASIFSGGVVIDHANTAGFGAGAWVAIYTGCLRRPTGGQAQELAYSLDGGLSWTKYAHNPVLDLGLREFRDPKVFWHGPSAAWLMAVVKPDEHLVCFFRSANLRDWVLLSEFGPAGAVASIWECPDLIHFAAEDRWVLKVDTFEGHPGGSGAQCWVGRFDGERFSAETEAVWVDHGSDFYAALSFGNLPAGRAPLWLAWMNNHAYAKDTPTAPWRGAMSLPRELSLRATPAGWRLAQRPWPGLAALRGAPHHRVGPGVLDAPGVDGRCLELLWELDPGDVVLSTLSVRCGEGGGEATTIGIDHQGGRLFIDRSRSGALVHPVHWAGRREVPLHNARGRLQVRVLIDHCSVEVFADEGLAVLTELVYPADTSRAVVTLAQGGAWQRSVLTAWPLKPHPAAARAPGA